MALHEHGYGGATARDAAAEMFAEELAQALIAQAQAQGLRIGVQVRGSTVLASLANGGCFRVSVSAHARDQ